MTLNLEVDTVLANRERFMTMLEQGGSRYHDALHVENHTIYPDEEVIASVMKHGCVDVFEGKTRTLVAGRLGRITLVACSFLRTVTVTEDGKKVRW